MDDPKGSFASTLKQAFVKPNYSILTILTNLHMDVRRGRQFLRRGYYLLKNNKKYYFFKKSLKTNIFLAGSMLMYPFPADAHECAECIVDLDLTWAKDLFLGHFGPLLDQV